MRDPSRYFGPPLVTLVADYETGEFGVSVGTGAGLAWYVAWIPRDLTITEADLVGDCPYDDPAALNLVLAALLADNPNLITDALRAAN